MWLIAALITFTVTPCTAHGNQGIIDRTQLGVIMVPLPTTDAILTQHFSQPIVINLTQVLPAVVSMNISQICNPRNHLRRVHLTQCESLHELNNQSLRMYESEVQLYNELVTRAERNFANVTRSRARRNIYEDLLHLLDISSYSDTQGLQKQISQVNSIQQQMGEILVTHANTLTKFAADIQGEVEGMHATLTRTIKDMRIEFRTTFVRERLIVLVNSQVAEFRTKLYSHRVQQVEQLTRMEAGLIYLSQGKISPQLIAASELERIIEIVNRELRRAHTNYQVTQVPIGKLYERIIPHTTYKDNQLHITLDLPITHNLARFTPYKIIPIPFRPTRYQMSLLEAHPLNALQLRTDVEYLLVQGNDENYIPMNGNQYASCMTIPQLCTLGMTITDARQACVPSIYRNDVANALHICSYEILKHPSNSVTFLDSETVFVRKGAEIQTACKTPENAINIQVHKSNRDRLLKLQCHCTYLVHNLTIPYRLSKCAKGMNIAEIQTMLPRNIVHMNKATMIYATDNFTFDTHLSQGTDTTSDYDKYNAIVNQDITVLGKEATLAAKTESHLVLSDEYLGNMGSTLINTATIAAVAIGTAALLGVVYLKLQLNKLTATLALLTMAQHQAKAAEIIHSLEGKNYLTLLDTRQTLQHVLREMTTIHHLLIIISVIVIVIASLSIAKRCTTKCRYSSSTPQFQVVARVGTNAKFVDVTILNIMKHNVPHLSLILHGIEKCNAIAPKWTILRPSCMDARLVINFEGMGKLAINNHVTLNWPQYTGIKLHQYFLLRKMLINPLCSHVNFILRAGNLIYVPRPLARHVDTPIVKSSPFITQTRVNNLQ